MRASQVLAIGLMVAAINLSGCSSSTDVSGAPAVRIGALGQIEAALMDDRRFAGLFDNATWRFEGPYEVQRLGSRTGTSARVYISPPIAHAGPWLYIRCQGTRQREEMREWSNVSAVLVSISLSGDIIGFSPVVGGADAEGQPIAPPDASPALPKYLAIRDLETGEVLWQARDLTEDDLISASEAATCPPGTED